jgi:predicted ATPase
MSERHRWPRFSKAFNAADLTPEIALRLEFDQLSAKAKMMPFVSMGGLSIAVVLALDFHRQLRLPWVALSLLSITFSYALMSIASYAWLMNAGQQTKSLGKLKLQFILVACCAGFSWAAVLIALMKVATPAQQELLFGLAIGLISTSVSTGTLLYSLSFWFPLSLGCFISLFVGKQPVNISVISGWLDMSP